MINFESEVAYKNYYWHEGDFDEKANFGLNEKGILMQFTGLLDKNGKEIYEGDITNVGIVEWDHGQFTERLYAPDDIEVIGNIYSNPELLN